MSYRVEPSGREVFFDENEIIVSKTDPNGRITYANQVFCRVAGYKESEVLGKPHSIIRHPDMPRSVFKLLWDTIQSGEEIFAYVVNICKNGDHYWVLAHVTPSFDANGNIIGYHSNRRVPSREAVKQFTDLYTVLREEEQKHGDKQAAIAAATRVLTDALEQQKVSYPEFIFQSVECP